MTTAQSIIESAYARSTANDPGKLAVDAELILHLNRKYQSLYAILAVNSGDNALTSATLTFAGTAPDPATAAVPAEAIDIRRIEATDGTDAYLIPADQKNRSWHLTPAMYRKGNTLYSRNLAGDPVEDDEFTIFYLDAPAVIDALADTLDSRFPVRFEEILVLDLAIYLSMKDEGRSEAEYKALKNEYNEAMATFNALVKVSNSAKAPPDAT